MTLASLNDSSYWKAAFAWGRRVAHDPAAVARLRRALLRDWRVHVIGVMLLVVVMGEFGVAAHMRELKDVIVHHPGTAELRAEFGRLHAIASGLYALEALLGLVLVLAGPRARGAQAGS